MRVFRRLSFWALSFTLLGCGKKIVQEFQQSTQNDPANPNTLLDGVPSLTFLPALPSDCPAGGTLIVNFLDKDGDGMLGSEETELSSTKICNGQNGSQGYGVGLLVESAPAQSCPAGGSVFKTFIDKNNNSAMDVDESLNSLTTLCNGLNGSDGQNGSNGNNGTNGQDGQSAHISLVAATPSQCPAGGVVYKTAEGNAAPIETIVCSGANGSNGSNGSNGQNGADANFKVGAVGSSVPNKNYTACHHDYLYLPDAQNGPRGWLLFRHQKNGSEDQGIGATGFQVWNVDITNFSLASEVSGVTYCNLSWDPVNKLLNYSVVDNSDGLAGQTGSLSLQ